MSTHVVYLLTVTLYDTLTLHVKVDKIAYVHKGAMVLGWHGHWQDKVEIGQRFKARANSEEIGDKLGFKSGDTTYYKDMKIFT